MLEGGELLLMQKLPTANTFGRLCWIFLLIGFFDWLDFSEGEAAFGGYCAIQPEGRRPGRKDRAIMRLYYYIIILLYYYIIILF